MKDMSDKPYYLCDFEDMQGDWEVQLVDPFSNDFVAKLGTLRKAADGEWYFHKTAEMIHDWHGQVIAMKLNELNELRWEETPVRPGSYFVSVNGGPVRKIDV